MIKLGNKSIKGIYIKIGTEIKQLFLKEKKDNKLIDYILYTINKDIEYEFSESSSSDRTNTFTIDNLIDVESISVDNGDVDYKIEGDKLIVTVKNGNVRNVYNDKKYSRREIDADTSRSNSFSNSLPYNYDGYTGTLYKNGSSYVISGSYEPSSSKTVTDYRTSSSDSFSSSMSYNSGGYTGTLSKNGSSYVYTGSYTPSHSKEVSNIKHTTYGGWGFIWEFERANTWSSVMYCDCHGTDVDVSLHWKYEYNQDGYSGTLNFYGQTINTGIFAPGAKERWLEEHPKGDYKNQSKKISGTTTATYKGTVYRPASDTRKWKQDYSGTVTKQGSDTRNWKQDYSGTVYKGGNDTFYKYKIKIKCKVKK